MDRLAISLATRGRPEKLVDTITRSIANWTHTNTVLWVMADADDEPTHDAIRKEQGKWGSDRVFLSVMPREDTIGEKWNRILDLQPQADLFLIAGDDDPYVTPGYDTKLLEAGKRFPDGIGMCYGHMANASFSGAVCPSRGMIELMGGKIFVEYFPYWFVDHWTDDLARIIGRISFADIRTDQSAVGKTQELREPAWWATFFDCAYLARRMIAHNIINSERFSAPMWLKEMLLAHHPMIEYRSRWINDNVRANARQLEGWSGASPQDDRYKRIKEKAKTLIPHFLNDYEMPEQERLGFQSALLPPTTVPNLRKSFSL